MPSTWTQPGRGRALRAIWSASDADVLAYMDVDLSTDLNALLPLVAPLLSGHSDVAIGTRLAPRRPGGPRPAPRAHLPLLQPAPARHAAARGFSDAQCGFKAIRADKARELLPLTQDTGWFFDTELLVLAERAGLRIHEVPVDWIDDTDSRVDIVATALADLRGIARLGWGLLRGTTSGAGARRRGAARRPGAARPAADRAPAAGPVRRGRAWPARSPTCCSIWRCAAPWPRSWPTRSACSSPRSATPRVNRRFTFGIRGRADAARHQAQGLLAFAAGLLLTSAALAALHAIVAAARAGCRGDRRCASPTSLATVLRFAALPALGVPAQALTRSSAAPTALRPAAPLAGAA